MTSHTGSSSLLRRLYHWTSSEMTIAEGDHEVPLNKSEEPPTIPKHGLSGDRAVTLDQTPADLYKISDMPTTEAEVPIAGSRDVLTMSDIEAVDEAPIAPDSNQTGLTFTMSNIKILDVAPIAAVPDVVERSSRDTGNHREPVIQNSPEDGSWIRIPNLVGETMVEVEISGTGRVFFIEKDLLCSKSAYFKTALNSGFKEAHTNKIPLEERLDLFQIFHFWLKQGNLNFMDSANWTESVGDVLFAFVEIYSFADRRGIPALADLILCKLDRRVRPGGLPVRLDVNIIAAAWDQLPETSKFCRYVVAIERDANKCNLPARPGVEYECLSGSFVAALLSATENSQWWTAAMVQQQRVNIAKVYNHIKSYGGFVRVDRLRGWDEIMRKMSIRAPVGCDQDKLRGQFRAMSRRWLRPWDATITARERALAEEECSRPLVRQFFHDTRG